MTPSRVLRGAWAGALAAAAAGLGYLALAPPPGSFTVDRLLAGAFAVAGAVAGVLIEARAERWMAARATGRSGTLEDARDPSGRTPVGTR